MTLVKKLKTRSKIEEFASRFVLASFRDRFIHEALKKPAKLHERICHRIEEVFAPCYCDVDLPFESGDLVFPIVGTDFDCEDGHTWGDVENLAGGGYGLLVASSDLLRFYAETESEPGHPYRTYGQANQ